MFISIEGIDGSGKTCLAEKLSDSFSHYGKNVKLISRKKLDYSSVPYVGNKIQQLNDILFHCENGDNLFSIPPEAWVYLNAAWFYIVGNNYLEENCINISDSWIYKRIARFSLLPQFEAQEVELIYRNIVKPDITFFIDTPPEETWTRRSRHSRKDFGFLITDYSSCTKERYLSYQGSIYKNMCDYAERFNWVILHGDDPQELLAEQVMNKLRTRQFL